MPVISTARGFDESRNTSRGFRVPHDALPNALKALAYLRRTNPALTKWIEDGHPNLTEAEHVERFGEPYTKRARK